VGHVIDDKLSDQQMNFVRHYLRTFNATKAAKAAGYSEDTAVKQGSRLLTKKDIKAAISVRLDKDGITAERVKVALAEIAFDGDIEAAEKFVVEGKSLADLAKDGFNTSLVKSISQSVTTAGGNRKVELYSRLDALDKLGKVLAMFTDTVEQKGEVKLTVSREKKPLPEDTASHGEDS